MKKCMLSILLCLCLWVGFFPTVAFAAEEAPTGEGLIPDQEVSGPCDVINEFTFNVTKLAKDNGYILRNVDGITWDANIGIISQHTITGVGHPNQTIELKCRAFDEPRSDYVRVNVTLNTGKTYFYVHIVLTGKYIVNISGVTAANAIWDGSPKPGYTGTPVYTLTSGEAYTGNDIEPTYTTAEGDPLTEAPSEVGKYYVIFAVPESNDNYKGSIKLPFQIFSPDDGEASYQAEAGGEWIETTFAEAVDMVYEGGTVKLLRDVSIDGSTVMLNKAMTITSADREMPCVITTQTDGHSYLFRIGADVELKNVVVDGGSSSGLTAGRAMIAVGDTAGTSGKLTLSTGSVVRNNNNTTRNGSGGGVCVISGECVIDGGRITGNSANTGGGISMTGTDNLTASLISGSIDNNTAAGLYYGYGYGGGVYVNGGSFTMSGGEIRDNQAPGSSGHGGGVYINGGSFAMTEGDIYDNTAARCGGAVYAANATVELQNGTITGNSAAYGGAMYINPSVTFELTGGSITGNTATTGYAGGIELAPEATVKLSGSPVVKGNTSSEETEGGGLYFDYDSSGKRNPPAITIGELTSGAELHWYTWMQKNIDEDDKFLIATPAEDYDAISSYDLSKQRYIDENYDLILMDGDMYLVRCVPATGITVTPDALEMEVGESETLTAALEPEEATCPVTWTSSDESVATVDNGVVTALKAGTVTITATAGDVSDSCEVTVFAYVATPVIAPNGGSFSGSQRVTISTSTVGAEIYYTTDGTEPSATNGKLYEGAFSIRKTTTIKAIAVKDGVNASEIVEATFTKASSETGGDDDDVVIRPTYYDIIIDESANGGVTSKHSSATAGTIVTLTVEPGEGYELRKLTVTDKDGRVTVVSAKGDGSYTFKMPNRDVYVKASFVKDGSSSVHICPSEDFRDVNTNLWYHEAIDFVLDNSYMNGMGNGMFAPASKLNRAMIVQVLYKMEGQPEVDTVYGFTDVAPDAWYADAVNWAAENEIVNGYGDTFGPLDPITREQMVTILYRYAEYKGLDTGARLDLSIFRDGGKVSSWAGDAVEWAVAVGLISTEGKGNGFFEPTGTATRAEVAQVLMNYCRKVLGE